MIKIKKAKTIGFCFGVKRAVDMANKALECDQKIYSLGPIIHNPLVVKKLSQKGIRVIYNIDDIKCGKVLIRSHGIKPSIRKKIKNKGLKILDATCPFVERSHRIVNDIKNKGFHIIIAGEKSHPEIVALAEASGNNMDIVINVKEVKKLKIKTKKILLLAQTTLSKGLYRQITQAAIDKNPFEVRIHNTICNDVAKRQDEVTRLSRIVDLILVIGGKNSANTKRLVQLCKTGGVRAFHLEAEKDLKKNWFKNVKSIGIMSGSSTPDWAVDEVISKVKKIKI
jgi:(E)-4-hydroxy-3-methyl-but-2-enyl pyrophosphate reductase